MCWLKKITKIQAVAWCWRYLQKAEFVSLWVGWGAWCLSRVWDAVFDVAANGSLNRGVLRKVLGRTPFLQKGPMLWGWRTEDLGLEEGAAGLGGHGMIPDTWWLLRISGQQFKEPPSWCWHSFLDPPLFSWMFGLCSHGSCAFWQIYERVAWLPIWSWSCLYLMHQVKFPTTRLWVFLLPFHPDRGLWSGNNVLASQLLWLKVFSSMDCSGHSCPILSFLLFPYPRPSCYFGWCPVQNLACVPICFLLLW